MPRTSRSQFGARVSTERFNNRVSEGIFADQSLGISLGIHTSDVSHGTPGLPSPEIPATVSDYEHIGSKEDGPVSRAVVFCRLSGIDQFRCHLGFSVVGHDAVFAGNRGVGFPAGLGNLFVRCR